MVVCIQLFLLFAAIFLHKRHNMTLKIVLNSNILNNKGIQTSFSHYPTILGCKNHTSTNIFFA